MRVRGVGPVPAEVMLIGEAPGKEEEQKGVPFVGKTGQELNCILSMNGLDRNELYLTCLVKERPPYVNGKQQPPSKEDIERDEKELIEELLRVRPKWVGALGRVATRWLCDGDLDMEASWALTYPLSGRIIDALYRAGLQWAGDRGGESAISRVAGESREAPMGLEWVPDVRVVPLYHPAAGLHNADLAQFVWRGLELFAGYVNGTLHPIAPVDGIRTPEYTRDVQEARRMYGRTVACDTEGLPGRVWGGSVSSEQGRAWVGSVSAAPTLKSALEEAPKVVFHNSLHDVPILEEIGIPVDWDKVEDTFLMAYCLRLVPMGLKALAKRFCGMQMQSYLDVIAPADRKLAREYVERAILARQCPVCDGDGKVPVMRKDGKGLKKNPEKCDAEGCIDGGLWPARDPQLKYDWDTGDWKMTKGWSVGRYLLNLRKDMANGKYEIEDDETGEVQSVRKRITGWPDDVLRIIETECGLLAEPTLDDIDSGAATYYSARDADATIRIYPILSEQIDQLRLREAYRLDLSVIPVAAEMQKNGMPIDRNYFAAFVRELETDNEIILAQLEYKCGKPINPASGDQVAGLLFGERGLPNLSPEDHRTFSAFAFDLEPDKLTKSRTRASVDDKVLEALKLKHAENKELVGLIDLILDYRVRDKILGTYARKIPLLADEWGFVHTTIKPCRTATFRWSSADPNLQNIPTRPKGNTDLGKRVREGFVAPPGYVLGSWDFDQIELRVLAWYSQDPTLLSIFRDGPTCPERFKYKDLKCRCHDPHYIMACRAFRVSLDDVTKDQRTSAKNIGFGVVYGVTAKGLKAQMELRGLHWTEEECQRLIDMYLYEVYPGVGRFMMEAHAEARRYGYVRSLFGHIRYVPGVHSSVSSVREEALRQAANFKIQCTAAELLKVAMRDLWHDYKPVLDACGAKLLMAVHDELLLMLPDTEEARRITDAVVTAAMTNPVILEGVDVGTTGKFDYNWANLK